MPSRTQNTAPVRGASPLQVCECPTCRGWGKRLQGYDNAGKPMLSGECLRCGRSGFVPLLDGAPSYPFGKDKDDPRLAAPVKEVRVQEGLL